MYNPSEISATIKSSAQDKKVTVKQLLDDCKINKGFIYDLEHKSTYPSCDKISRIADYFNCSVDYLLGRTDCPELAAPAGGTVSSTEDMNLIKKYRRLPESLQTAVNQILNSYDDLKTDSSETLTQSNDISTDAANVVAEGEKIFGKTHTDVK